MSNAAAADLTRVPAADPDAMGPQRKAKPGRPGRTDEEPRARFAVASLRALEAVGHSRNQE